MSDYVIVGAGPAGCAIAARLSEDPKVTVTLVEAGGPAWHPLIHIPAGFAKMTKGIASWGWSTVPQRHLNNRILWYTQAKVAGGGSSINAQIYTRGHPADYDNWARSGCDGWSYREALPYFKRAEDNRHFLNDYHAGGGAVSVSHPAAALPVCEAYFAAAEALGIPFNPDFNGAHQAGVGYYQLTQRNARRSSATAYLAAARKRPNLIVRTKARALRILVEKGRARGVAVAAKGGVENLYAARETVISCGAIGSPLLLQLSGIGPAEHLNAAGIPVLHDLPGVGANLQDHLNLSALFECTGAHSYDDYAKWHRALWAGMRYLLFRDGPAASSLFETGGFWYADGGDPGIDARAARPDIQLHLGLGSGIEAGIAQLAQAGVTLNSAYLRPSSRGTVRAASSDPAAAPLIDPNYWSEPSDRVNAFKGLALARDIMRQDALKPFIAREALPGAGVVTDAALFDYACANAKTDHHPVGTCRMGNDALAVVGADLKVRGIEGLRVADASVMPRIPSCNTNAPTLMIGEKAADLIASRPPLPPVDPRPESGSGVRAAKTANTRRSRR